MSSSVVRIGRGRGRSWLCLATAGLGVLAGCDVVGTTDRQVEALIAMRQKQSLGYGVSADIGHEQPEPRPGREAYDYDPRPSSVDVPPDFEATTQPAGGPAVTSAPAPDAPMTQVADTRPAQPLTRPRRLFKLTDALAYAQRHRREYQTAKEDLYLSALALTLERHLWTPIFAANLRTVYGNYGQVRDFDQAMRFVADLEISQRLPYGGEFTAEMISTLIRDVKRSITASEDSVVRLGLRVPFLRGAGHVARETLIQLERELTYSVRTFERFRRQQLVTVAQDYFDLLRVKQRVIDSGESVKRFQAAVDQATALESIGKGTILDRQRAEADRLSAENDLANAREEFRSRADQFKITIGMPVDEPLALEELETIESIERQVAGGRYPILRPPPAVEEEQLALGVALERRLDLLTQRDRIDDARRGVAISRNALLPDLEWTGSVQWDTDPEEYRLGGFHFDSTTWRTELVLELPLERKAEQNALRRALIDVRQSQRNTQDAEERVRAEVRSVLNLIRLADTSLEIQRRRLEVARSQKEYAEYRFSEIGDIDNRDLLDAERELLSAQNQVNSAKTSRWNLLLQFRLATETLHIDEEGVQYEDDELPPEDQ